MPRILKALAFFAALVAFTSGAQAAQQGWSSGQDIKACFNTREPDQRIAACTRLLSFEQNPRFFEYRGDAYILKNDYDRATSDYSRAIDLSAVATNTHLKRGLAYKAKGEYDRARADIQKAHQLDPSNKRIKAALAALGGTAANARSSAEQAAQEPAKPSSPLPLDPRDAPKYNASPTERPAWLRPEPPGDAQQAVEPAKPEEAVPTPVVQPAAAPVVVPQGKRVALVIGNSAYEHISSLDNPEKDARLIAAALGELGFTLIGGGAQLDLDNAALEQAVQNFGREIQGAEVALFYYTGHGVQVRGTNYLVPVGANPAREADVDFQMLDANLVLRQMEGSGSRLNLLVLDACRNNPFGGRGLRTAASGLAQMQAPEGTLISFATQPGNVALDGTGDNSPFTKALAETIRKPGLDIFRTFNEVGLAVKEATAGAQQPWTSSSPIKGEFYFAGRTIGVETKQGAAPAAPATPDPALAAWNEAEDTTSASVLEAFIARFGDSFYAELAKAKLADLKKEAKTKVAVVVPPKPVVAREHKPGETFKDCDDCPEMVVVPAGSFLMGASPQRRVEIDYDFAVGKYEVTVAEWNACVKDGACSKAQPTSRSHRPMTFVFRDDIDKFLSWLRGKSSKNYRLLSEAEWEYAARANSTSPYFFGEDEIDKYAWHTFNTGSDPMRPNAVGGKLPNAFGLYDMYGNAMERVADCWHKTLGGAPSDGTAWTTNCQGVGVLRGGSTMSPPAAMTSGSRYKDIGLRVSHLGFRVARTLE